jgi:hypothetical protein
MSSNNVNVTSYFQSGGITAHTVNIGAQPRHINEALKNNLENNLSNHKEKDIKIMSLMGDGEANVFAHEIREYLISKGYKVNGFSQAVWPTPLKGQGIEFPSDGTVLIWVGSNTN